MFKKNKQKKTNEQNNIFFKFTNLSTCHMNSHLGVKQPTLLCVLGSTHISTPLFGDIIPRQKAGNGFMKLI